MDKISQLDSSYEEFIKHLNQYVPDGIQDVNLTFLSRLHLLHEEQAHTSARLTRFFHVVETKDKVTLFNDQFVVWIVPERNQEESVTLVLLGIAHPSQADCKEGPSIHLETAFMAAGVYNTSRTVLRVIEKLLADIQENEELISRLEKTR